MRANYQSKEGDSQSMDRGSRRAMVKRLMPKIKRIVELEKQIKTGDNKSAAEDEMNKLIETLTMVEMFAVEDYIYNHKLLDNKN